VRPVEVAQHQQSTINSSGGAVVAMVTRSKQSEQLHQSDEAMFVSVIRRSREGSDNDDRRGSSAFSSMLVSHAAFITIHFDNPLTLYPSPPFHSSYDINFLTIPSTMDNQQLQEQEVESDSEIEWESDDEDEEDVYEYGCMMTENMALACKGGDEKTIVRLLDKGERIDDGVDNDGKTPTLLALMFRNLSCVRMLVGRGADLSRTNESGRNALHIAAAGGDIECINWVLANTSIDVNSNDDAGYTPIRCAASWGRLDAGLLLVEKGANLFLKNDDGESVMDIALGPQLLQHAKDLIWVSVRPLLLLSKACSTSTTSSSLIKVFSISGLVRDYIAPYVMRKGLITRDPEQDVDKEPEADEVKLRVEAALAAASSLFS
jgi:hypothetical protein